MKESFTVSIINEHIINLNKYEKVKAQLQEILPILSRASQSIGRVDREVGAAYKVNDDRSKIGQEVSYIKKNLDTDIENLQSIVIPDLNQKIQGAKEKISVLEFLEDASPFGPSWEHGGGGHDF